MIFRLCLFLLAIMLKVGLKVASFLDSSFKESLKGGEFTMQINTIKSGTGRYFRLQEGKLSSGGKIISSQPDLLIEWSDGGTALSSMMKLKPSTLVQSLSEAITSGKLAVEATPLSSFWFMMKMKEMMQVYVGLAVKLKIIR